MAVWQFSFDLIPVSSVSKNDVSLIRLSRDDQNSIVLNISKNDLKGTICNFEAILPRYKSWHEDLMSFGHEEKTDIQIWLDGDMIESIQFRISAYEKVQPELLRVICDTAQSLNCVFADRKGAIFQPSASALIRMMRRSRAARFVQDPAGFLTSSGADIVEPSVI